MWSKNLGLKERKEALKIGRMSLATTSVQNELILDRTLFSELSYGDIPSCTFVRKRIREYVGDTEVCDLDIW